MKFKFFFLCLLSIVLTILSCENKPPTNVEQFYCKKGDTVIVEYNKGILSYKVTMVKGDFITLKSQQGEQFDTKKKDWIQVHTRSIPMSKLKKGDIYIDSTGKINLFQGKFMLETGKQFAVISDNTKMDHYEVVYNSTDTVKHYGILNTPLLDEDYKDYRIIYDKLVISHQDTFSYRTLYDRK